MMFISSILKGGLGNYLFQIAAGQSVAWRDNKEFVCFLHSIQRIHTDISIYYNNILRNVNFINNNIDFPMYEEPFFHYKEIPIVEHSLTIDGYFQSEKYFTNYIEDIRNLFKIDSVTKEYLENKYKNILSENTCSIHVRRGNYLNLQNFHPVQSIEYYKKAIDFFSADITFLIFSDDINWCKNQFQFLKNKIFIENNKDYEDLYLMSMCKNNIIANSSFSWWGSYLNLNTDKIVVAPKLWFGNRLSNNNTKDLYCSNWNII
jgi:hypothetical protein